MFLIKNALCFTLAFGSLLAFALSKDKAWETTLQRRAVWTAVALKVVACVALYTLWPELNRWTDAANFYLPQTQAFLAGDVPNRDYPSSYSPLFYVLLALPVKVWPSVGAIALVMIAAETAMLAVYLRRPGESTRRWRVAFLYSWSPFSFYWVAMTAHNGVLVALSTMAALALAERGRNAWAGVTAALGYWFTKLLALLAWPAVVAFRRKGTAARTIPLVASAGVAVALLAFGFNVFTAMGQELGRSSTGNLWFLVLTVDASFADTVWWRVLPSSLLAVAVALAFAWFVRHSRGDFTAAAAFVAVVNLLFMILSKKTYNYYLVMFLPFLIHTLMVRDRHLWVGLISLAAVSAVTYLEEVSSGGTLVVLDVFTIVVYSYWIRGCLGATRAGATPPA